MGSEPPVLLVHHARKGVTSRIRPKQKAYDSKISKCCTYPRGNTRPLLLPKLLSQETTEIMLVLELSLVLVVLSFTMVGMFSFLHLALHTFFFQLLVSFSVSFKCFLFKLLFLPETKEISINISKIKNLSLP